MLEQFFRKHRKILFSAPVGYGKTSSMINVCRSLENIDNWCIVVPNVSNVIGIQKRFGLPAYYCNEKSIDTEIVTTYSSLRKLLSAAKQQDITYNAVIYDEAHILTTDMLFRDGISQSFKDFIHGLNVMSAYITATSEVFEFEDKDFGEPLQAGRRSHIKIAKATLNICNSDADIAFLIQQMNYDVVYWDSTFCYDAFNFMDTDYILLYRGNILGRFNKVVDRNSNLTKQIFTTRVLNAGVDIMNDGQLRIAIVLLPTVSIVEVIQFLGRFRQADVIVDFYIEKQFLNSSDFGDIRIPVSLQSGVSKSIEVLEKLRCNSIGKVKYCLDRFTWSGELKINDFTHKNFGKFVSQFITPREPIYLFEQLGKYYAKQLPKVRIGKNGVVFYISVPTLRTFIETTDYIERFERYFTCDVDGHTLATILRNRKVKELVNIDYDIQSVRDNKQVIWYRIIK